jgi:Fur family peroxide stress response transcriptional regulator
MMVPKAELERRLGLFREMCRRKRLKATHQRMEVFRELAGSDEHPDAETVYQQVRRRVPAISRDTVYRTLATLMAEGLIRPAAIPGGSSRYDANTDRHHHFVCTVCGKVQDFRCDALDALPIPPSVVALGRIESAQVHVRGICSSCARPSPKRRRCRKA